MKLHAFGRGENTTVLRLGCLESVTRRWSVARVSARGVNMQYELHAVGISPSEPEPIYNQAARLQAWQVMNADCYSQF
jgi:hypothetical protein